MKKTGLLFILVLIFSVSLLAQDQKPFRFGLKIGPNFSWMKPDAEGYASEGMKAGFSWGFISDFNLAGNYFLSTGFNMQYNNGKLSFPYIMDNIDTTGILYRNYRIRYLQIPLMIKMRTDNFDNFAIIGQIGVAGDVRFAANGKDVFEYHETDGTLTETAEKESKIKDDIRLFKASFVIGGGIEYFINNSTSLLVNINYNNGLTNILDGKNKVNPTIKEKAMLNYVEINVGIIF